MMCEGQEELAGMAATAARQQEAMEHSAELGKGVDHFAVLQLGAELGLSKAGLGWCDLAVLQTAWAAVLATLATCATLLATFEVFFSSRLEQK